MLDQVAAAFDRKDYRTAAQLLKKLLKESPQNPWVQFYAARLQEVSGKLPQAENIYRQLLRDTTNPKLASQARQGLQRLEEMVREQRKQAIAQATADPGSSEVGCLILEPISPDVKMAVAQNFARIMKLDAYTARMHLPSRGWRFYRTGAIGELQVYVQELQAGGIPAFCATLTEMEKIQVFQVHYIQAATPQAVVICENEAQQLGSLAFSWSEVTQRIEGLLPIFEQVVDVGRRNKLERKEQTQDYAHFCDLHLPSRNCILRLYDAGYQFNQGLSLLPVAENSAPGDRGTIRIHWNSLVDFLNRQLPEVPTWSEFTSFAETALEQTDLLNRLKSHVRLFRKTESFWDPAFHLYSSLVFLKNRKP